MSAAVLQELAKEKSETAEHLAQLSAQQGLDSAETGYIVASGVGAVQRAAK
jgi:hypothetical protein